MTVSPQARKEVKVWLWDWKALFRSENIFFPDFQRKQDKKVIWIRDKQG
jgi:hypothetical protein